MYIKRCLENKLQESLKNHPVLILSGPRQVGKSTLLKDASFLKNWRYITLDDKDVLNQAKIDPKGLLKTKDPTIIDEIQREPELLLTVKLLVDESHGQRQFILSGSGNISLRQSPRETLAGRAKYFHLTPLSFKEQFAPNTPSALETFFSRGIVDSMEIQTPLPNIETLVWKGGLPKACLANSEESFIDIMGSYVDTYIKRDIQDLLKIRYPDRFRKLMNLLADATGWETKQDELSKESGESRSNVSRYLSLLVETGLLHDLRGFFSKNENAYRQSKYYWFDTGVACFLSGLTSSRSLAEGRIRGRYFENFVLQQINFFLSLQPIAPTVSYWKQKRNSGEVDFILQRQNVVLPIEVKNTYELTFRHTERLRSFLTAHPNSKTGLIVYNGSKIEEIATGIFSVPLIAL